MNGDLEEAGSAISLSAQQDHFNSNEVAKPAVLSSASDGSTATAQVVPKYKHRFLDERIQKRVEIAGLWLIILVALGLLCLPIVFYHIRSNEELAKDTNQIQAMRECVNPDASSTAELLVSSRSGAEDSLLDLLGLLNLFEASGDCRAAAVPFACQYLFPLCDSNGELYLPSAQQCRDVTTDVCVDVWQIALAAPEVAQRLPTCDELPENITACTVTMNVTFDEAPNITCRENFFQAGNHCVARCDSWEQNSPDTTKAVTALELFSALFGLVASVLIIIVSCLRRKTMFSFPSILIVYMTLGYSVVAIFVVVTYIDRGELYCGEIGVNDAFQNPTSFCTASGVVLQYFILNITLWWFFHVSSIFWKLQCPMHARKLQQGENLKYIHIGVVIAGLLIPVPGVMATAFTDGYTINRFPPLLCSSSNTDAGYYSVFLIMNILLAIGISMLIFMFWKVHKHQGFIRYKETNSQSYNKLSHAEKKLLFVFAYYIVFAVVTLVYFGLSTGSQGKLVAAIVDYFLCEADGFNAESPCPRNYERYTYPVLAATTYLLMGFIPAVSLIFVVHVQKLKHKFMKMCVRLHLISSYDTRDGPASTMDRWNGSVMNSITLRSYSS